MFNAIRDGLPAIPKRENNDSSVSVRPAPAPVNPETPVMQDAPAYFSGGLRGRGERIRVPVSSIQETPPVPNQDDSFRLPINQNTPDAKQIEFESSEAGQVLLGMIAEQNVNIAKAEIDRTKDTLPPETPRMRALLERKDTLKDILTTCLENPVDDEAVCLADRMGISVFDAQRNKDAIRKLKEASTVGTDLNAEAFIRRFPDVAEQILSRPDDVQVLRNNFSAWQWLKSKATIASIHFVSSFLASSPLKSSRSHVIDPVVAAENERLRLEEATKDTEERVPADTVSSGFFDHMRRSWRAGVLQSDLARLGKEASDAAYVNDSTRFAEIMRQVTEVKRQIAKTSPAPSDSYLTNTLSDSVGSLPLSMSIMGKSGALAAAGAAVGGGIGFGVGGPAGAVLGAKIGGGITGIVGLGAFAQPAEEGTAFLDFYGAESAPYIDPETKEVKTAKVDPFTAAVEANHYGHLSAAIEGADALATLLTMGVSKAGNGIASRIGSQKLKEIVARGVEKKSTASILEKSAADVGRSAASRFARTAAVSSGGETIEEATQQAAQIYYRQDALERVSGVPQDLDWNAAAEEVVGVIPSAFFASLPFSGGAVFAQHLIRATGETQRKNYVRAMASADAERMRYLADNAAKVGPDEAALFVQRFGSQLKTSAGAPLTHVNIDAQDAMEFIARNSDDVQAASSAAFGDFTPQFASALQNGGMLRIPLETFVRGFAAVRDEQGVTLGQYLSDRAWMDGGISSEQAKAEIDLETKSRASRIELLSSPEEPSDISLNEYMRLTNDVQAAERFSSGRLIVDMLAPKVAKGNITEEQARVFVAALVSMAIEADDASGGHSSVALNTLRAIVADNPQLFEDGQGFTQEEILAAIDSLQASEKAKQSNANTSTAIQLASSVQSPKEKLEEMHADNERRNAALDAVAKHQEALRIADGNPARAAIVEHIQELQTDPTGRALAEEVMRHRNSGALTMEALLDKVGPDTPLTVFDIEHKKWWNDAKGHESLDTLLRKEAKFLNKLFPGLVAQNGNAIVVALPEGQQQAVLDALEKAFPQVDFTADTAVWAELDAVHGAANEERRKRGQIGHRKSAPSGTYREIRRLDQQIASAGDESGDLQAQRAALFADAQNVSALFNFAASENLTPDERKALEDENNRKISENYASGDSYVRGLPGDLLNENGDVIDDPEKIAPDDVFLADSTVQRIQEMSTKDVLDDYYLDAGLLPNWNGDDVISNGIGKNATEFSSNDLSGVKDLNNILGHDATDRILAAVSWVYSKVKYKNFVASHQHGDEYKALLLPGKSEKSLQEIISEIANRLKSLTFVLERENGEFVIVHGIGVQEGFGSTFAEADKNLETKYADKSLKPKYSIGEIDFSDGQHTEDDISGLTKGGLSITTIKNFSGDPKKILLDVLSEDDVIDLLRWEAPNERVLSPLSRTNVNGILSNKPKNSQSTDKQVGRVSGRTSDGSLYEGYRGTVISSDEGRDASSGWSDAGRDVAGTESENSRTAGSSSGESISGTTENRQSGLGRQTGTQEDIPSTTSELGSGNRLGLNESSSDESTEAPSVSSSDTVLSQDTRGKTVISAKEGRKAFRILLSEDADISTLAHEVAHIWFVQFADLATSDNASKRVKEDYARILEFVGAKQGESFTEDQQEKFARGFELFLMEGNAPSKQMERPFDRFKKWLGGIYKKIEFSYDVELNDNIRPVFQRMFATDRQVRAYAEEAAGQPIPSIDDVPISEYVDYLEKRAEAVNDLTRNAEIAAYRQKMGQLDADAFKRFRELVESETKRIQDSPGYAARQLILTGRYVSSSGVEATVPNRIRIKTSEVQKALNTKHLPPTWRPFVKKDGLTFQQLQQLPIFQNFSSPDDLFEAIEDAPSERALKHVARRNADAVFQKEFKEELESAKAELKAKIDALAFSPELLKSLNDELKILGRGDVSKEIYARARAFIQDKPLSDLNAYGFMRESRRLDARFRTEFALGNKRRAFGLKFNQTRNFAIATEIFQARERAQRWQSFMNRLSDDDFRKRIGKKDARFLDVLDALAEKLNIKKRTLSSAQMSERSGVSEFVDAVRAHPVKVLASDAKDALVENEMEVGFDPKIVQGVLDGEDTKFNDLSPRQQENVHAVVVQAVRASRDFYELKLDGETYNVSQDENAPGRNIFEVLSESMPKHWLTEKEFHVNSSDDSSLDKVKKSAFRFHVLHLEASEKLNFLGPIGKAIMQEMLKAEYKKNDLGEKVLKRVQELFIGPNTPMRTHKGETVTLPDYMQLRNGMSRELKHADLLMMALNTGNGSNLDRLVKGYGGEKTGWTKENVFAFLNAHLDKNDWDFVQQVWDLFSDDLYAETQRVYRAVNGVPMTQIEPVELQTRFGTYRGGYFPIFYHPEMSAVGKNVDETAQSTNHSTRVTTSQGFTKSRAAAVSNAPLDLDFSRIFKNIASEIHYISHEETVRKLSNLFNSEEFQRIVTERGGAVAKQALLDLLKDFAQGPDGAKLPEFAYKLERAFYGMVIGATFGPAIGDVGRLAAAGVSGEVSMRGIVQGTGMAVGLNREARNEIIGKSEYLKLLQDNVSSRFKSSKDSAAIAYNGSTIDRFQLLTEKINFALLEFSTRFVGSALFVGAYTDALRNGKTEAEAIRHGDQTLINWMPNAIDWTKATLQNNPLGRIATVFAGEGMKNGVIARRLVGNAIGHFKEGDYTAAAISAVRAFGAITALGLVSALVMGQGKEKDEDWDSWAARTMLIFMSGMDPYIFQPAAPAISKRIFHRNGHVTEIPVVRTVKTLSNAAVQLTVPEGDRISPETLSALLDVGGVTLHMPSNELKKILMPAVGAKGHDEITYKNPVQFTEDLTEAVIYGRSSKRPWNPISQGKH